MRQFWVVGGDYADTGFSVAAPGANLEKFGPFDSYDEAYKVWAGRTWATVDRATTRYRIVDEAGTVIDPRA